MTAVRKFLFDIEFDDPEVAGAEAAAEATEETESEAPEPVEEAPPPPTFSEDEMEAARRESFEAGKREGVQEASAAMERQINETLNGIAAHLGELFEAERKDVTHLHALGIHMIRALAHKVLPQMSADAGTAEIERLAANVLDRLRYEPHVLIAVHDSLSAALDGRMQAIADVQGFAGTVEVVADSEVAPGDCRIEWSDGGAERRTAALMREIDAIVERHLAGILDPDELDEIKTPCGPTLDFDPEMEADAESAAMPSGDPATTAEPEPEPEVVDQAEPEPEPEAAVEPELVAEMEPEPEAEIEPATEVGTEDAATDPDTQAAVEERIEDTVALEDSDADLEDLDLEADMAALDAELQEDIEELTPEPAGDGSETPVSDDEPPDDPRQGE